MAAKDPVTLAKNVFDYIVAKHDPESVTEIVPEPEPKDRKAQAAGKLGGKKGGKARAAKLSPSKRKKIASNAAKARWKE